MAAASSKTSLKLEYLTGFDYDSMNFNYENEDETKVVAYKGDTRGTIDSTGKFQEDALLKMDTKAEEDTDGTQDSYFIYVLELVDGNSDANLTCPGWHDEEDSCLLEDLKKVNLVKKEIDSVTSETLASSLVGDGVYISDQYLDGSEEVPCDVMENSMIYSFPSIEQWAEYKTHITIMPCMTFPYTIDESNDMEEYWYFYVKSSVDKWGVLDAVTNTLVIDQKYDTLDQVDVALQFEYNADQTIEYMDTAFGEVSTTAVYRYTSPTERTKISADFTFLTDSTTCRSNNFFYIDNFIEEFWFQNSYDSEPVYSQSILHELDGTVFYKEKDVYLSEYRNGYLIMEKPTGETDEDGLSIDSYALAKVTEDIVAKDEATNIQLSADSDEIPANAVFSVTAVSQGSSFVVAQTALKDSAEKFTAFDIKLTVDNRVVQPTGKVTITIPIPAGYDKSKLVIYYIAADGTKTEMASTISGDTIIFETDHFSTYALAQKGSNTTTESSTTATTTTTTSTTQAAAKDVKTGEASHTAFALGIVVLAGMGMVVIGKKKKA